MTTVNDMCLDVYPPGESFDPALPELTRPWPTSPNELAASWRHQWQPGQELRIRFLDGTPALHQRVEQAARGWLDHANLRFSFGRHATAEIRVSFQGNGYWSYLGTHALTIPADQRTLQLGGFTETTRERELRRVVLHEFGHAIGCIHEQASPTANIPWDEAKVYAHYKSAYGWSHEKTYTNVLARYGAADVGASPHDPTSIMQYAVPAELTLDGSSIGWNTELSAGDTSFIRMLYPGLP